MTTKLHFFKFVIATTIAVSFASLVRAANISSTATGGNWSVPGTWMGGAVPTAADNVTIVAGATVTVDINNAACSTLVVNSATNNATGTLAFNANSVLTVGGAVTIGGMGNRQGDVIMTNGGTFKIGGVLTVGKNAFTAGTGTVEYTGTNATIVPFASPYRNVTFSGSGTAGSGGALSIQGNLSNTGGGTLSFTNNVQISGNVATQSIAGFTTTGAVSMIKTGGTATFTGNVSGGAFTINGVGGTLNLGAGLTHTFTGNWTRTNGTLNGGSSLLKIGGSATGSGGTFTAGAGTVEYNSLGAQTVAAVTYNNLTLSNKAAKTVTGATVNGKLSMQGTATAAGTSPTFGPTSTLEYAGSAAQTTSTVEFPLSDGAFNLIINNSNGVTLDAARTINGAVTFTSGILHTTLTNLLTFANAATSGGSSDASFVDGPVRKVFNAAESFTFPVGATATGFSGDEPLRISGAALNNDFTAQYLRSPASALGGTIPPLLNVSNCDQWILTKNSAPAASISLTLSWDANSPCPPALFVTDPATLTIGHFNGTVWDQAGTTGSFTGTATSGTVTRNNVTQFSPFSLANTAANQNPLPLSFGNIKGYAKNGGIQIDWTTLTESNVDHYEIERSVNGTQQFETIGRTAAHNTPNQSDYTWLDANPVNGTNFYRIKSVDLDGKVSYSIVIRVNLTRSGEIVIYPNPTQKSHVSFQSGDLQKGDYILKIFNSGGQEIYTQKFVHEGGALSQTISLPAGIKSGMYNLQLRNGNDVKTKTFIVQ